MKTKNNLKNLTCGVDQQQVAQAACTPEQPTPEVTTTSVATYLTGNYRDMVYGLVILVDDSLTVALDASDVTGANASKTLFAALEEVVAQCKELIRRISKRAARTLPIGAFTPYQRQALIAHAVIEAMIDRFWALQDPHLDSFSDVIWPAVHCILAEKLGIVSTVADNRYQRWLKAHPHW